jgi:hypothetical protein
VLKARIAKGESKLLTRLGCFLFVPD